jgi:hypothetical protein
LQGSKTYLSQLIETAYVTPLVITENRRWKITKLTNNDILMIISNLSNLIIILKLISATSWGKIEPLINSF